MLNSHHKDQIKRAVGKTKQGVIYAEIIFHFFFLSKRNYVLNLLQLLHSLKHKFYLDPFFSC